MVSDLLRWIASGHSNLADLDERMIERYLRHRARNQSIQPGDRVALRRLLIRALNDFLVSVRDAERDRMTRESGGSHLLVKIEVSLVVRPLFL